MAGNAKMTIFIGGDNSDFIKKWNATKLALKKGLGTDALELSQGIATGMAAAVAAMGALGVASIKMAGDMQAQRTAFATLLGDAKQAEQFLQQLARFAAETPFELPGLVNSAKKLLAFGFAAQDIIPMMSAIGDAASMLGMGQEGIDRMTIAIGQMQAKGKVSAEEMLQLAEAGVPAWKFLADAIGTDIPTAMDMAKDGAIDATTGINAVLMGMQNRFKGGMEGMSKEIPGLFSTIKDNVTAVAREIGDKLIEAFDIKTKMQGMADYLSSFADYVKQSGLNAALRDLIPPELTAGIFALAGAITAVAIPAIIAFGISLWTALAPLLPFIAVGAALGALAWEIWRNWEPLSELFSTMWTVIVDLFDEAWAGIKSMASDAIDFVSGYIGDGWNAIGEATAEIWNGIADMIGQAWESITGIVASGIDFIVDHMTPLTGLVGLFAPDGVKEWFNKVASGVKTIGAAQVTYWSKLKLGFDRVDISNFLPKSAPTDKTFKGLSGTNANTTAGNGSGGTSDEEKAWDKLVDKAKQVSKAIYDEWVQTTLTEKEQLDIWRAQQLADLEETKDANENYQRDLLMLESVYSVRRKKILDDEAKKRNSIWDKAADAARALANKIGAIGKTGVVKEKFDIEKDATEQIDNIRRHYRDWTLEYSQATEEEKATFRAAWVANGIQFEITEQGMVDFSKQMAAERISVEQEKNQKLKDLYYDRVKFEEDLEQARKDGDVDRYKDLLNSEQALLKRDLEGKQDYIDAYYDVWKKAHRSNMSYMAEGLTTLYNGTKDLFSGILDGTKSIGEAFQDLGKKVLNMINDWVSEWIAARIMMGITNSFGSTTTSSSSKGVYGASDSLNQQVLSAILPHFATGGDYAGGMALVGEKGPELINFNTGGRVYNASDTADMLGGSTYQISVPVSVSGDASTRLVGRLRSDITELVQTIIYEEARA